MKQFLSNILFFLIFLFGVYIISLLGIKFTGMKYITPNINSTQGGYGNNLERFNEIGNYSNLDVLFLGSSHTYRGFDPRIFKKNGYSSFNLGSSAQPPFNSYFLLKQYLKTLTPKTVFLEVYWGTLASKKDAIESTVDIVSNKNITLSDVEMTFTQHHPIAINTMMYSYVSNLLTPLSKVKQKANIHDKYINGGFVERTDTSGITNKIKNITGSTDINYDPFQMEYLKKIANLCKSNGIKLVLIRTPVTKETIRTVKNFDTLNAELILFSKANTIEYIDFCTTKIFDEIGLNTLEDFYDGHHMTQSGVEKFNEYLMKFYQQF